MKNFIIAFIFTLLFSCDTTENETLVCGTSDPLNEIEWLNDIKTGIEMRASIAGAQIIQFRYKGEYVFLVDDWYQCPDAMGVVYNCQGEPICEFGGFFGLNTCPDFHELATDSTMLFDYVQH